MSAISRCFLRSPLRNNVRARLTRGGHGPQYNEPGGYLFNEKPLAAGQKRVKEDWEDIWYFGMYGGFLFAAVGLYYKPDSSFVNWAYREAERRMEERGEVLEYKQTPNPLPQAFHEAYGKKE
ncbi:hypothetical protein K7432_016345 [Basidiobolus ranarum]|uniref:NADH dehydrogenase [ubiquinone] 1 beta subcomplex subunit 11, mitochondrial n=2 Tax=Basidiobolus ranarum TaxID=34480 RepID=A0ABR2VLQ6_9FUNG